jgi:hypothetical protein
MGIRAPRQRRASSEEKAPGMAPEAAEAAGGASTGMCEREPVKSARPDQSFSAVACLP